jgi:hypothetical protein
VQMLIGLYTKEGDLELGGNTQGLLGLAQRLMRKGETQFDLPLSTSGADPTPYDGVLSRISVKIGGEQPLYIGRTDDTLRIEGSQKAVEIFASDLESLARQGAQRTMGSPRVHMHVEYYPGHYFLDERSEPIVIASPLERHNQYCAAATIIASYRTTAIWGSVLRFLKDPEQRSRTDTTWDGAPDRR